MPTQAYPAMLCQAGLSYLTNLSDKKLVALDLETTGLSPVTAQITQAGAVHGDITDNLGYFGKTASLSDESFSCLAAESRAAAYHRSAPMHWVLGYNSYHEVFSKLQYRMPGILPNVSKPCAVMGTSGVTFVSGDTPYLLNAAELEEVRQRCSFLLPEDQVIRMLQQWVAQVPAGSMLVGQNILAFDLPFLYERARCSGGSFEHTYTPATIVDTMWVSRVLAIPALRALGVDDKVYGHVLRALHNGKGGYKSSLQDLRKAFGVTGGAAHSATGDCVTTLAVLRAMVALAEHVSSRALFSDEQELGFEIMSAEASTKPDRR